MTPIVRFFPPRLLASFVPALGSIGICLPDSQNRSVVAFRL